MKKAVKIDPKKIDKLKKMIKSEKYIDKALNGLAGLIERNFDSF